MKPPVRWAGATVALLVTMTIAEEAGVVAAADMTTVIAAAVEVATMVVARLADPMAAPGATLMGRLLDHPPHRTPVGLI